MPPEVSLTLVLYDNDNNPLSKYEEEVTLLIQIPELSVWDQNTGQKV